MVSVKEKFYDIKRRWIKASEDDRKEIDKEFKVFLDSLEGSDDDVLLWAIKDDFAQIKGRIREIRERFIAESEMVIKSEEEFKECRAVLETFIAKGTELGGMGLLAKEDKDEVCRLLDAIEKYESVYSPLPGKNPKQIKSDRFLKLWTELVKTEGLNDEDHDNAVVLIRDEYQTEEDKKVMEEYLNDHYSFLHNQMNEIEKDIAAIKASREKNSL